MSSELEKIADDVDKGILTPISNYDDFDKGKAIANIVNELFKKDNLNRVTDVDDIEIVLFSANEAINSQFPSKVNEKMMEEIKELRISKYRLGREEVLSIAKEKAEPKKEPGLIDKLLGNPGV